MLPTTRTDAHRCRRPRRPRPYLSWPGIDDGSAAATGGGPGRPPEETETACPRSLRIAASVLLLPPWISRAAVYLSTLSRGGAPSGDPSGEDPGGAHYSPLPPLGTTLRETAEILAMSVLQDCAVATVALGLLLPAVTLGDPKRPVASGVGAAAAASAVYVLAVAPVWLDLLSQLLAGVRIRTEYVTMVATNAGTFSSSLAAFFLSDDRAVDVRLPVVLSALVGSGCAFVGSVASLSRRWRGGTSHPLPLLVGLRRPPRLRRCARPLIFLAVMHVLFLVAVLCSLMVSRTSLSSALLASNVVFMIGSEGLGLSYLEPDGGFLLSAVDSASVPSPGAGSSASSASASSSSRPSFVFPSERYADLDPTGRYPFYRRTTGFAGPRAFEINANATGRRKRPPNVVLIMMETWRHMDVGVLGGTERLRDRNRTATPNFDRLASDNVLFDNFYANGVQTSRTLMSTLFGTLPQFTTSAAVDSPKAADLAMSGLPSLLKSMGYRTQFMSATGLDWQGWDAFLPAHGFDEMFGIDRFAERFREMREGESNATSSGSFEDFPPEAGDYSEYFRTYEANSWGMADGDAFRVLADEVRRLSRAEEPFFVDFYSISSHHPFEVPASFAAPGWIQEEEAGEGDDYRKYLQSLAYSDEALGAFFDSMDEFDLMENTIFLVAGDHGFGFCEHKPCFDGMNIGNANSKVFDEVSRVPMMIVGDMPTSSRGTVVKEAASQVDLMSTVMDVVGFPKGGFIQHGIGRSLVRKLPQGLDVAVLQNTFNEMAMGMKIGEMKYVFEGSRDISVYNFTSDPHEMTPLYRSRMKKSNDPLKGAPEDTLRVRDKIAKLLLDTTRCFHSNTFIPPSVAKVENSIGDTMEDLAIGENSSNGTEVRFFWKDWTWNTDLKEEGEDPFNEFENVDTNEDFFRLDSQTDAATALNTTNVELGFANTESSHEVAQNNTNTTVALHERKQ